MRGRVWYGSELCPPHPQDFSQPCSLQRRVLVRSSPSARDSAQPRLVLVFPALRAPFRAALPLSSVSVLVQQFAGAPVGSCAGLSSGPSGPPAATAAPHRAGQRTEQGGLAIHEGLEEAALVPGGAGSDPGSAGASFWAIGGSDQ